MEYIKKDPRIFEEQTFGYTNSTSCLYSNVYDTFDVMTNIYALQKLLLQLLLR